MTTNNAGGMYNDDLQKYSREQILTDAIGPVNEERKSRYGSFVDNMHWLGTIATQILPLLAGKYTNGHNAAIIMAILKLIRIVLGEYHPDNYLDAANFIAQASDSESKARASKTA